MTDKATKKEKNTATVVPLEGTERFKVHYSNRYMPNEIAFANEGALRQLLNARHKERKANKPKERYVIVPSAIGPVIMDTLASRGLANLYKESYTDNIGRTIVKALNKQERKRLACNTVTPGFTEI